MWWCAGRLPRRARLAESRRSVSAWPGNTIRMSPSEVAPSETDPDGGVHHTAGDGVGQGVRGCAARGLRAAAQALVVVHAFGTDPHRRSPSAARPRTPRRPGPRLRDRGSSTSKSRRQSRQRKCWCGTGVRLVPNRLGAAPRAEHTELGQFRKCGVHGAATQLGKHRRRARVDLICRQVFRRPLCRTIRGLRVAAGHPEAAPSGAAPPARIERSWPYVYPASYWAISPSQE